MKMNPDTSSLDQLDECILNLSVGLNHLSNYLSLKITYALMIKSLQIQMNLTYKTIVMCTFTDDFRFLKNSLIDSESY